jgi:hypothetical protein
VICAFSTHATDSFSKTYSNQFDVHFVFTEADGLIVTLEYLSTGYAISSLETHDSFLTVHDSVD